jgi:hypothetical protein
LIQKSRGLLRSSAGINPLATGLHFKSNTQAEMIRFLPWRLASYIAASARANRLSRLLTEHEGLEELAKSRTARLLKIGLPELMRMRK